MLPDGMEQFVSTPELHSENSIGSDPLPAGQLAADKGAQKIIMPISARKQLYDMPDELATKVTVVYYADAKDALLKALSE